MKARLSLSIDTDILKEVKKLSAKKNMNISEMVEDYFKIITRPKRKTLIELLDELPKVHISEDRDLVKEYYDAKMKKYGI